MADQEFDPRRPAAEFVFLPIMLERPCKATVTIRNNNCMNGTSTMGGPLSKPGASVSEGFAHWQQQSSILKDKGKKTPKQ